MQHVAIVEFKYYVATQFGFIFDNEFIINIYIPAHVYWIYIYA